MLGGNAPFEKLKIIQSGIQNFGKCKRRRLLLVLIFLKPENVSILFALNAPPVQNSGAQGKTTLVYRAN